MSYEFTLHSIARSIFTDELLDSFLAEDQKTVDQRDPFLQDQVYQEKKAALAEALTPAQAAKLTAMEALHRDALRALSEFSVFSGLYTGFQRVLTDGSDQDLFLSSAAHDALDNPRLCPAYSKKHQEAENLFRPLRGDLPEPARTLLADVEIVWADRVYGVALQGFRLGLLGALRALTVLGPKEVSQDKLLPLLREAEELS